MPKGYYVEYSYVGFMPDGTKRFFVTQEEYLEEFYESVDETT